MYIYIYIDMYIYIWVSCIYLNIHESLSKWLVDLVDKSLDSGFSLFCKWIRTIKTMRGMKSLWIPGMTLDSWGNLSIGSNRKSQPIQPIPPPPIFFRPKKSCFLVVVWSPLGRLESRCVCNSLKVRYLDPELAKCLNESMVYTSV